MARRGQHSFLKRQKEIKRKERAGEKMARRQGKIERPTPEEEDEQQTAGHEEDEQQTAENEDTEQQTAENEDKKTTP